MPELPEVETTRRGIQPYVEGETIIKMTVRQRGLRWPIPDGLETRISGQTVHQVARRAKYLLLQCDNGTLLVHLGMSGILRVRDNDDDIARHDHVDIYFSNDKVLRFTDPRRFGAILWAEGSGDTHPLIAHLGPEPLSDSFNADYLYQRAKGRRISIKSFIMDGKVVVGVGNIYANEALFLAGIHPATLAGRLGKIRMQKLVSAIKQVLDKALQAGGTTLRDFRKTDGNPGYFSQALQVYGRKDEPCPICQQPIQCIRQAQRATYYCKQCQSR